ncbi:hypothetical protein D0S45_17510 [Marinifilum sp. JC120]|nr:hypothetical protein D0S45_17510 [Marinifilum sp. JC120]
MENQQIDLDQISGLATKIFALKQELQDLCKKNGVTVTTGYTNGIPHKNLIKCCPTKSKTLTSPDGVTQFRTYGTPEIQDLKKKLTKALDEVGAGYSLIFYEKGGSDMTYKSVPAHPIIVTTVKNMADKFVLCAVDEWDESYDPRDRD